MESEDGGTVWGQEVTAQLGRGENRVGWGREGTETLRAPAGCETEWEAKNESGAC